jgi:hypothetical protein
MEVPVHLCKVLRNENANNRKFINKIEDREYAYAVNCRTGFIMSGVAAGQKENTWREPVQPKRSEMFASQRLPAQYQSAKSITVTGMGGIKYVEILKMGVGSKVIAYLDDLLDACVYRTVDKV